MKKILILGISGLLGSQTAIDLIKKGYTVIGVNKDRKPFSRLVTENYSKMITMLNIDLLCLDDLKRAISEYEPDFIIHLAAQPIVVKALSNPHYTLEINIRSVYNLLEAVRAINPEIPLIIASTDKVYGEGKPPFTEISPLNAVYPYDVSKLCADRIACSYRKSFSLKVFIIRPANIYGPGDIHRSRLIPDTIMNLIEDKNPVLRSNGQFIRDFIFVEDISRAICILMEAVLKNDKKPSPVYNIGSGRPNKIMDIVEKLIKISGKPLKPVILDYDLKEIREQWLDIRKVRDELGFYPKIDIDTGLQITYKWYLDASENNKAIFTIP